MSSRTRRHITILSNTGEEVRRFEDILGDTREFLGRRAWRVMGEADGRYAILPPRPIDHDRLWQELPKLLVEMEHLYRQERSLCANGTKAEWATFLERQEDFLTLLIDLGVAWVDLEAVAEGWTTSRQVWGI